jgi:hypothetical protein
MTYSTRESFEWETGDLLNNNTGALDILSFERKRSKRVYIEPLLNFILYYDNFVYSSDAKSHGKTKKNESPSFSFATQRKNILVIIGIGIGKINFLYFKKKNSLPRTSHSSGKLTNCCPIPVYLWKSF